MSRTTDKDAVPQEAVIAKALGFIPVPGKPIRNPLREDKSPGAFFAWKGNKLRLQDYADPDTHGMDCWDIYMMTYRITNLNDAIDHFTGGKLVDKINLPGYFPPTFEFRVDYTPIPFNNEGLSYWGDYGITEEQLLHDGVRQVDSYSYNSKYSDLLSIEVTPSDVCFALPPVNDRNKIYRPTTEDPALKWKADMLPGQMWGLRNSEEPADVCFIGSGYKDIRVVMNFGLEMDVMASTVSESGKAEQIASWGIMKQLKGYKLVVLGMDFDPAGHNAENQWALALKFHGIPYRKMQVEELTIDGKRIKDYAATQKYSPSTAALLKKLIQKKIA